jgi:hypothetical protein
VNRIVRALLGLAFAYLAALLACYFFGAYGVRRHHVEAASFILAALVAARWSFIPAGDDLTGTGGTIRAVTAIAVLAGGAAYFQALGIGLLSDDYVLRRAVLDGHLLWGSQFARPAALAIWRVVFMAGGGAVALHLLNLGLHLTNAALAGILASRLGLRRAGAYAATLVFLLWPTQVEPVAWAAGVFDLVSATWMLLALLLLLRERPLISRSGDIGVACALAVLALLSKESAVALPFLALLAVAPDRRRARAAVPMAVAMLIAIAAYMAWRVSAGLPVAGTATWSRYVLKEQLSRTFGTLALPLSEPSIQAYPMVAFLVIAGLLLCCAVVFIGDHGDRQGRTIALQGLAWCVVAAAPTIGFLFIGPYLDGSRYLYLSTLGWGLAIGGLLDTVWDRRPLGWIAGGFVGALLLVGGIEQHHRLGDWRQAAIERDRILTEAVRFAGPRGCGSLAATGLPPRLQGAQLFNNGFPEAFEEIGGKTGGRQCDAIWTGVEFRER